MVVPGLVIAFITGLLIVTAIFPEQSEAFLKSNAGKARVINSIR